MIPEAFETQKSNLNKIVLIGATTHPPDPVGQLSRDFVSFCRTEIFEILHQKPLMPFQNYKFQVACQLADFGLLQESLRFILFIYLFFQRI